MKQLCWVIVLPVMVLIVFMDLVAALSHWRITRGGGICTCQAVLTWPRTLLSLGPIAKPSLHWLCCLSFWKLVGSVILDCYQLDMCHFLIRCVCSWGRPEFSCCKILLVYVTHTLEACGLKSNIVLSVHNNESLVLLILLVSFPWKKLITEAVERNTLEQWWWQQQKSKFKSKCGYLHLSVRKYWQWSRILKNLPGFWNITKKILLLVWSAAGMQTWETEPSCWRGGGSCFTSMV